MRSTAAPRFRLKSTSAGSGNEPGERGFNVLALSTCLVGGLRSRFFLLSVLLFAPHTLLDAQLQPGARPTGIPGPGSVIRAVRASGPINIDGVLDEPTWEAAPVTTGFRQRWPVDGAEASERTEVRVAFDDRAIYFGMVMHDSEPEGIMRTILHREGRIDKDDRIIIALDTYHDRQSAYIFELNPFGTQGDAHFTNERLVFPGDWMWEGVYESDARITERGWELEVAIPLTTIRFGERGQNTMGLGLYRSIRRKNEEVTWPHISLNFQGGMEGGMDQASQFGTLVGLEDLRPGRHIEVKPFAISGSQKQAGDEKATALNEVGLDVKYSVTSNLTLDLTYNTDFAQVEADNVQINLDRFGLFYPEKREFFLERSDLFQFGNSRTTELFFSRRIGLTNDILGGGRLHGQIGPMTLAFLNLQTEDEGGVPGANNTVVRLRGSVFPRGNVGGIFTNFQNSDTYNRVLGLDADYRFWGSSIVRGWWATGDEKGGPESGADAGHGEVILQNELYGVTATYTSVGEGFDPALGFVRRRDMVRMGGGFSWRPRFPNSSWARQFTFNPHGFVIEGQDGRRQSQDFRMDQILTTQSGDMFMIGLTHRWERLEDVFRIRPDVELPAGDYPFNYAGALFRTNDSREFSAQAVTHFGEYWSGDWFQYGGALNWKTGPHLELTGLIDRREIDLPVENGEFSTTILGLEVLGAVSRNLFANALVQFDNDSEAVQANIRIDWIHTPGSDLFLVLNTGYFTGDLTSPHDERWLNRAGVIKLTYLKAF
jgi:hypothetical protein